MAEPNWNKISAIGTWVGVLVALGFGLGPRLSNDWTPTGYFMTDYGPVVAVVAGLLFAAGIHLKAASVAREAVLEATKQPTRWREAPDPNILVDDPPIAAPVTTAERIFIDSTPLQLTELAR